MKKKLLARTRGFEPCSSCERTTRMPNHFASHFATPQLPTSTTYMAHGSIRPSHHLSEVTPLSSPYRPPKSPHRHREWNIERVGIMITIRAGVVDAMVGIMHRHRHASSMKMNDVDVSLLVDVRSPAISFPLPPYQVGRIFLSRHIFLQPELSFPAISFSRTNNNSGKKIWRR